MAETFAGKHPGADDPTMRHASGQTTTQDASVFTFKGEVPKGTPPTGSLILVNYLTEYMGDTLHGVNFREQKK